MTRPKLLFRILLTPLSFAAGLCGLRASLSLTLYMSRHVGDLLTLVILCTIAFPVFLALRGIRPNLRQVWNFEYPIVSNEVAVLILWYFLITFFAVIVYMILTAVFSLPFR